MRQKFVQISGDKTESKVQYNLGPQLFSMFVNELAESTINGELYLFADDTTIYTLGKNIDELGCLSNKLVAHESKTEAMLNSRQTFVGPIP